MEASEILETIFGLLGGLAIFLFGMNQMSASLQKCAGDKMRQILGALTRNRVLGCIAGALVTAVLQSSSATTVMAIGFVSAGLMTLPQAISVIFGANIGTTMTAQLLAFKISDYIYPIIFIGFLINFIAKKDRVKSAGMVILSFGLLFEGIEIMGSVMKPLASLPVFTTLMGQVADIPILGVLLGAVMTLLVQSSSATIAVLQNFASQPAADGVSSVIGLAGAIPILLGDNIGTTITALLASIGQSKNAKRTAVAHSIFNISGSILFLFLIPWFTQIVQYISPSGNEIDVISRQIANAHTLFNVTVTIIWLPLLGVMVKIVNFIIRGDDEPQSELYRAQYLDGNVIGQAMVALYNVTREISRVGDYAVELLAAVRTRMLDRNAADDVAGQSEGIRSLTGEISDYLTTMFTRGTLNDEQAEQAAGLLYVSNNIGRIAERCDEISQNVDNLRTSGRHLPEKTKDELLEYFNGVEEMFGNAMQAVQEGSTECARAVTVGRGALVGAEKKLSREYLIQVNSEEDTDAGLNADFSGILYNLERIADNCAMVAEEAMDNLSFQSMALPEAENSDS